LDDSKDSIDKNYPWNESLSNAITYFLRYIDPSYIKDYEGNNPIYTDDKDSITN
jgi:hypothetical protein